METKQGLDSGLRILEALMAHDRISVRTAAAITDQSVSSAQRALNTLVDNGYALRAASGRGFVVGPKVFGVMNPPVLGPQMRRDFRLVIERVREASQEAVHVALLVGNQVLVVDGRRSKFSEDIGLRRGMVAAAHTMAAGKLLLAGLDPAQVRSLFPHERLLLRGPGTIQTRTVLEQQLATIRASGVAYALQESEAGVNSVALLLQEGSWRERAAIVVSVPVSRGSSGRMAELERTARAAIPNHTR
ncbi:MAG: IclR family transcriptional regulator C-terminal domain-containing protein [Aquiluna sp.]